MMRLFNFSNHSKRCTSHFTRNYKTKIRPDAVTATDSEKTSEKSMNSSMRKYFEEHGLTNVVERAPENYLKRSKKVNFCTAVNPELAKRIAFSICSRLDEGFIVESDPGFGFMSRVLVSLAPRLFLCESNEDFRSQLEDLKMKHDNVQITNFNVFTLLKMIRSVQTETLTTVNHFYEDISSKRNASNSHRINWIFSSLTKQSIRNLCFLQFCDTSFQQLGKMTYYITLSSALYKILSEPFSHGRKEQDAFVTVLFQVIFDFEILMTGIPRKMYLPWPHSKDPSEDLLLIRVAPKSNVENLFDSELLAKSFIKFLLIGLRRKRRVIPLLEKYVNNCGPLFILEHGMTVYTEFLELSPEKLLSLFMYFSKLPEFSHSTFIDDEPDEFPDEPEATEKILTEEVDHFEDDAESVDDEDSQSEDDETNESSQSEDDETNENSQSEDDETNESSQSADDKTNESNEKNL